MALILPKPGDIIPVKIGELIFKISPLSQEQRLKKDEFVTIDSGEEVEDETKTVIYMVKTSIKGVEGVKNWDGSDYKLSFDENGDLTDESVQDIVRLGNLEKVILACAQIVNSIPEDGKIRNPINGEIIEGMEVVFPKKEVAQAEVQI